MNRIAIWPYAVPMDSSGKMMDDFQGIYSRGLCRAFAEGLLRTRLCEVAVCLPIITIGGATSWAVTGREWSLDETVKKALPEGTGFATVGTMSLTERVELHVLVVSGPQRSLILDRRFSYPRTQILNCLSEAVQDMAAAIAGRPLSNDERRRAQHWGTTSTDAYLAYLEAWSAVAASRFGVTVPNPEAALECVRRAARIDPKFVEASRLEEQLSPAEVRGCAGEAAVEDLSGYSEFACPIAISEGAPRQS
jgi:hypothetical protein